tara:strand:- start:179 stop:1492 length:1314 start_codon:yes stop_codon:yes gene_type:complete
MYNFIKHPVNKKIYNLKSKIGKKLVKNYIFFLNGGSISENLTYTNIVNLSHNPLSLNYISEDLLVILLNSQNNFIFWSDEISDKYLEDKNHNRFILINSKYKSFKDILKRKNIHYYDPAYPNSWKFSSIINNSNILDYSNYVLIPQLNYFYKFIFEKGCLYNSQILQNKDFQRILKIATVFKMLIDYSETILEFDNTDNVKVKATNLVTELSILLGGIVEHDPKHKIILDAQRLPEVNEDQSFNFNIIELNYIRSKIIVPPFLYLTIVNILNNETNININQNLNENLFEFLIKLLNTDQKKYIKFVDVNYYLSLIEDLFFLEKKHECPLAEYAKNIIEDFISNTLIFSLPPNQEKNFQNINFKMLTGLIISIEVDVNSYIGIIKKEIKDVILEKNDFDVSEVSELIYSRSKLKNYKTLSEYGITENTTLNIYCLKKK